jgi:hypothetical protein
MSRCKACCHVEPGADPPRLGGWMSLSRIAHASDVSMSPSRHRRIVSKPIASLRATPCCCASTGQRERRCLTFWVRNALAPSGLGRGAAFVPRRLPSCQESSAGASDQHTSAGRCAARRYCAPFRLACSATLPSRSPSAPAALGGRAQEPEGPRAHPSEMRLADFCNPHFKDEHPGLAWFPTLCAPEKRAIHVTRSASPSRLSAPKQLLTAVDSRAL